MRWIWERLFGSPGEIGGSKAPGRAIPANDEDILDDVRAQIRRDVAAGFGSREDILTSAIEVFEGEVERSILEESAARWVDEEFAAHAAAQLSWPTTTDCDRLDAAFVALQRKGIVARHHFTCCGTCGSSEIWDEIAEVERNGGQARGYAFYHWQDTEHAVDGYGIYLNYGACAEGEEAALQIAHEIVDELARHDLQTEWNGTFAERIGVKLDWKRRRAA